MAHTNTAAAAAAAAPSSQTGAAINVMAPDAAVVGPPGVPGEARFAPELVLSRPST